MEVSAYPVSGGYPASYLLPLRQEAATIHGWLEVVADQLTFADATGLELRMRLDRLRDVTFTTRGLDGQAGGARVGTDRADAGASGAELSAAGAEQEATEAAVGVMRLLGSCGPAHVRWEMLIGQRDAAALGETITAALGVEAAAELTIELDREPAASPRIGPDALDEQRPRPQPGHGTADHEDGRLERREEHARLIRRRRIAALTFALIALMLLAELLVSLLLLG